MDPQLTRDGKPYGPVRFKEIVREQYIISKQTNNSILDVDDLTPRERELLLDFIEEDQKIAMEAREKAMQHKRK